MMIFRYSTAIYHKNIASPIVFILAQKYVRCFILPQNFSDTKCN